MDVLERTSVEGVFTSFSEEGTLSSLKALQVVLPRKINRQNRKINKRLGT